MSAVITKGSNVKGLISVVAGLLISTIGIDVATGYPRFTFGNIYLISGIDFIPVMIGLFGISEVIRDLASQSQDTLSGAAVVETSKTNPKEVLRVMGKHKRVIAQSSIIGTLIGALPGAGADIAAWVAYGSREDNQTSRGIRHRI